MSGNVEAGYLYRDYRMTGLIRSDDVDFRRHHHSTSTLLISLSPSSPSICFLSTIAGLLEELQTHASRTDFGSILSPDMGQASRPGSFDCSEPGRCV